MFIKYNPRLDVIARAKIPELQVKILAPTKIKSSSLIWVKIATKPNPPRSDTEKLLPDTFIQIQNVHYQISTTSLYVRFSMACFSTWKLTNPIRLQENVIADQKGDSHD